MDGESAPGSGGTPGTGTGTGSATGPAPATPAEVRAVEEELLGRVVDAPGAGGLGRQATHTTGTTPSSSRPPTPDDIAAYVGLVELSQPTPPLPGIGPIGSTRRLGRLLVASGFMGLFGVILLLAVLASRSGGSDPGGGSTTGAGGPAASVEQGDAAQGDAAQPSVHASQPGSGDGGGAAGGGDAGIVPASCKVPTTGFQVELRDLAWTVELATSSAGGVGGSGDVAAGWDTGVRNLGSEPIAVFRHYSTYATREGAPDWKPILPVDDVGRVNNAWDRGWVKTEAGVASDDLGYSSVSLSAEPPPLCDYRVVDRPAVLYARPECLEPIFPRMKESEADPTARDEFMNPLAIEGILPDQMATLACP